MTDQTEMARRVTFAIPEIHSISEIKQAVITMFQTRDVRGKQRRRNQFIRGFVHFAQTYPSTAIQLLRVIPTFGRFKDLVEIWMYGQKILDAILLDAIVSFYAQQLERDFANVPKYKSISNASKWLPQSRRRGQVAKFTHGFRRAVRDKLFGADHPRASEKLRKLVSACNKALNLVETNMSTDKWHCIMPHDVPRGALNKYHCSLYNQNDGEFTDRSSHPSRQIVAKRMVLWNKYKTTMCLHHPSRTNDSRYDVVRDILETSIELGYLPIEIHE